ncbi:MAG: sodium-translocating pyrophosphatase, partial [Clostridiales bacterium]|nr:sodium-translocating pyrophosphatase [Clostridiales bacterium]
MSILLGLVILASLLALGYAAINFYSVKRLEEGTERMVEIGQAIRLGANTFINYEYKVVAIIGSIIAVCLAAVISWQGACAFIIGATMSASAGYVGMKIATYANVRVTNTARKTNKLGDTLKVAFKGGSVMGLCVAGFALLGIFIVYSVFGYGLGQISDVYDGVENTPGLLDLNAPFSMTISCYALGCSVIAMFNRVGGGIYTKAADMGADLVGKTEAHIPEDDPRNPATIADNVGDNVGDVAGLGADLLESYVGAIMSAAILACELFGKSAAFTNSKLLERMLLFPVAFAAIGLISCILGIASILLKKTLSEDPHMELNLSTWISAGITAILGFVMTYVIFGDYTKSQLQDIHFKIGWVSPWVCAVIGVVAGIIIGAIAEYYTSYDYKPTRYLAGSSVEGAALTITQGLALGMKSCMAPVLILGGAIYISSVLGGMYGISCASIGMLSFVAATVSVDTYGPISDNAGGIAEMSYLDESVRNITDKLDSVGNTTAAIGKGFAIGSAALATLSMMNSYQYSYNDSAESIMLDVISPLTLAGAIIGAALPFLFSGILIEAVAKAARKMVDEVRRQFKEIPGLLEGK